MTAEEQVMKEMTARDDLVCQLELRCTEAELALQAAKEHESRLAATVRRFRELRKNSPVAFLTFDGDGRIVEMNRAACELLEMNAQGAIGLYFGALIAGASGLSFLEKFRKSRFPADTPLKAELELITNKRNRVTVEAVVLKMPLLETVLFEVALIELTEQKAIAAAEAQGRQQAESIVAALPFPILVLDGEGRILSANAGFYQFFQTVENRVINYHITDLPGVEWQTARLDRALRQAFSAERIVDNMVVRAMLWRGSLVTLQMTARRFAMSSDSKPYLLVAFEDITRRQWAEEERGTAMRALEKGTAELERRVDERTRELQRSYGRLRDVGEQLILAHESEQRRIARELHDQVGQDLTALKITLSRGKNGTAEEAKKTLQEAEALTEELLQTVRDICGTLRPQVLDDLGLVAGLKWHIKTFGARTGIDIEFVNGLIEEDCLSPIVKSAIFRVIQEALTNVSRHADAKSAHVSLAREDGLVEFSIRDRGKGFDVAALEKGSTGISSMRERLSLVQGRFEIASSPGRGTVIKAQIPVRGESANNPETDRIQNGQGTANQNRSSRRSSSGS